jgi:hypothetical protein
MNADQSSIPLNGYLECDALLYRSYNSFRQLRVESAVIKEEPQKSIADTLRRCPLSIAVAHLIRAASWIQGSATVTAVSIGSDGTGVLSSIAGSLLSDELLIGAWHVTIVAAI